MENYTFTFNGEITVRAESEEKAFCLADNLIAVTAYQYDNAVDISIGELTLVDKY